jgi:hypothetical protein
MTENKGAVNASEYQLMYITQATEKVKTFITNQEKKQEFYHHTTQSQVVP